MNNKYLEKIAVETGYQHDPKVSAARNLSRKRIHADKASAELARIHPPGQPPFKLGHKGKIGLGLGAVGTLGLGAYALSRNKKEVEK